MRKAAYWMIAALIFWGAPALGWAQEPKPAPRPIANPFDNPVAEPSQLEPRDDPPAAVTDSDGTGSEGANPEVVSDGVISDRVVGDEDSEGAAGGNGQYCDEFYASDEFNRSGDVMSACDVFMSSPLGACGELFATWLENGVAYGNVWYAFEAAQAYWAKAEYLTWDAKGDRIPALVTTSTPGTPQSQMGVLGKPNTYILFGDGRVNDSSRAGTRVSVGYGQFDGWQADYMILENAVTKFSQFSNGNPILARPFDDAITRLQNASLIAAPSVSFGLGQNINLRGGIDVTASSQAQSAGLSIKRLIWQDTWAPFTSYFRLQGIGGYRWFQLEEQLSISDTVYPVGSPFVLGSHTDRLDVFRTQNDFHGGEFGLIAAIQHNRVGIEFRSKLAMGNMQELVTISGHTHATDTRTAPINLNRGFLAQNTNIGSYKTNQFALIPEIGIDFSVQLTSRWKATVGYTFLYVSQAVQPGEFVDLGINQVLAAGLPSNGPRQPAYVQQDTDFYAQGLNGGFEFKF